MPSPRTVLGWAALALVLTSCSPAPSSAPVQPRTERPDGSFSVMTYNLMRYAMDDRDGDGQADDPKPPEECRALVSVIARARPDLLAVQELGSESMFRDLAQRLKDAGLDYPHADFMPAPQTNLNLGVFSRFPITGRYPVTNEYYTIGESVLPVQRGFQVLDVQVNPDYRFRLVNVHLKSKVFSPHGQTEMRRNEARLLNKQIRGFLKDDPKLNLLVVGDFNDQRDSAALREAMGKELEDLRPRDAFGDVWTHFWREEETYARIDYLLVSEGMGREVLRPDTVAIRDPDAANASDHRPLLGVFLGRDR